MPKLPLDILRQRLREELRMCKRGLPHQFIIEDESLSKFPVRIYVTLVKTPGPIMKDGRIHHQYTHKFMLEITDEYPYEKPIVRWQTPIFHPNIMGPDEGGYVCIKLLDTWKFGSNLLTFIKGIETLLSSPNPTNPYASATCMEAARYFYYYPYKPPGIITTTRTAPKIVVATTTTTTTAEETKAQPQHRGARKSPKIISAEK